MKLHYFIAYSALFFATTTWADQNVVNNAAPAQAAPQCGGGNQNNIYDPRIPPAGVYTKENGDGSSDTLYTTGEKKPYYVDSNCNQSAAAAQPIVYGGPSGPGQNGPNQQRPNGGGKR
jgi:hypothetical protein